jgi:hypothetical protein
MFVSSTIFDVLESDYISDTIPDLERIRNLKELPTDTDGILELLVFFDKIGYCYPLCNEAETVELMGRKLLGSSMYKAKTWMDLITICDNRQPVDTLDGLSLDKQLDIISGIIYNIIKYNIKLHPVTLELLCTEISYICSQEIRDEIENRVGHIPADVNPLEQNVLFRPEECGLANRLSDILGWRMETVVFPQFHNLVVYSNLTGNTDDRSGSCSAGNFVVDDFKWSVSAPHGITLRNLSEAVYRLKGSKYDCWYELFTGFVVRGTDNGCLTLQVEFDYGS